MNYEERETLEPSDTVGALGEVLAAHAPGVRWTPALVANFSRAIRKRGFVLVPTTDIRGAQVTLDELVRPTSSSNVMHTWARCVEYEAKLRKRITATA